MSRGSLDRSRSSSLWSLWGDGRYWATITQAEPRRCPRNGQRTQWLSPLHSLSWSLLVIFLVVVRVIAVDFSGQFVSVFDGDTIEVLHNDRAERIRLSSIDCPEKKGQAYGKRAKQAASELVFGREVTLQSYVKDKYRRTIAARL